MTKSAGDRTLQGAGALNVYIGQLMDNLTLLSAQAVKLHDETSTLAGVLAEVPDAMACGGTAESPEPTKL